MSKGEGGWLKERMVGFCPEDEAHVRRKVGGPTMSLPLYHCGVTLSSHTGAKDKKRNQGTPLLWEG